MVIGIEQRVSEFKHKEEQLHTSLDNLRGDRRKLKEYRAIDKELKSIVRKRQNLESALSLFDGMFVHKPPTDKCGVIFEIKITPGGHAEVWVSWDGGVPVPEQPELLTIDRQCNLQLPTFSVGEEEIRGESLPPDTNPYGQLSQISTPLLSIEKDSPKPNLLKQTLEPSQTNSLKDFPPQTCLSSDRLVQICPPLANEPDLMAIAHSCFLKQSDFCDYKSLKFSSLRMSQDYSAVTIERTLNRLSHPSLNWGMWGFGNYATDTNGFPKTDNESSFLVLTGDVQCTRVDPNRLTLQQCLEDDGIAIIHKARGGDRTYTELAPTLRSLSNTNGNHQSGNGAWKVKQSNGVVRPLLPTECELLMGWSRGSTEFGIDANGKEIKISNTQRQKMLGNGIIPQEIEDICNSLRLFLEAMKSNTAVCSQGEFENNIEPNYGMMDEILPAQSLATGGGIENQNQEVSTVDHHTISGMVVAANFKIGDRVKLNSPVFPDTICTISALPSREAAIVELENGARERLLVEHLEPLNKIQESLKIELQSTHKFEIIEELSSAEERERHRLELKVERAFYEAGCALRDLRDKRLYRSTHKTFEEYCSDRFGFARRHPYRLIDAVGVVDNLCPIGTQNQELEQMCPNSSQVVPTSERQVRDLVKLQPHEQRTCWQQAVDLADGKVPTGKIVKGVVERLLEKPLNFASEYCSVGEIFRLQRLVEEEQKYNGWWGIALEVENRLTVKCQVYDKTIEIRQDNIKQVDMTKEELEKQQEIIERVSRLARCNLDPAVWALLEVLNRQNHHTDVQLKLLAIAEQLYGIHSYEN